MASYLKSQLSGSKIVGEFCVKWISLDLECNGENPEVLQLAALRIGHELPPGGSFQSTVIDISASVGDAHAKVQIGQGRRQSRPQDLVIGANLRGTGRHTEASPEETNNLGNQQCPGRSFSLS